jgi:N-dimethylarginine dimethylaminohydrolase
MSFFSPIAPKKAVIYSRMMPVPFRQFLIEKGYSFIEVPDSEYDSLGCNVLALSPNVVVIAKGNPLVKAQLVQSGCEVIEYDGREISWKGSGGPTCLTRPLWRESAE